MSWCPDFEFRGTQVENSLDVYLSPPGVKCKLNGRCLRVRQFNGRLKVMFREYVTDGNFIISPRVDLDVSIKTIRGLLNLGYRVAALMEVETEVIRSNPLYLQTASPDSVSYNSAADSGNVDGLTVCLDTLPQVSPCSKYRLSLT